MNLVIIGVVCLALIGVACLYFGKDGAIISTIIALIGGAAGFGVSKAKQELAPGNVQMPVTSTDAISNAVSLVQYSVPIKTPMLSGGEAVDFQRIDSEIDESITTMKLADDAKQHCALALNRAVAARVKSLDEVKQWNSYLLGWAKAAVKEYFEFESPDSKAELDVAIERWKAAKCRDISEPVKVLLSWLVKLFGMRQALARLEAVGLDWNKLAPPYQTAWYIAELAYNPVVQIGITSEDVV